MFLLFLILIAVAYVLGSLSSAVITSKLLGQPDPRTQGSGNAGATNVLRLSGKQAALFVLVVDILKGLIPVLLAHAVGLRGMALAIIGLAAVVGHIFPVFFNFQGGKGIATALGVLLGLSSLLAVFVIIIWIIVAAVTRYSSLASLIACGIAWLFSPIFIGFASFLPFTAMIVLICWKHWGNIERLRAGTESKISF